MKNILRRADLTDSKDRRGDAKSVADTSAHAPAARLAHAPPEASQDPGCSSGVAYGVQTLTIDPVSEACYWRSNHGAQHMAVATLTYEECEPAYRYGWESFGRSDLQGSTFESIEAELGRGWERARGASQLGWDHAKAATREAWERVKNAAAALAGEPGGSRPAE
jgi:hypothetical protein